jgi:ABC-type transport system involved in cytochrome bd biosynthesis fused ATPase/permease subunit
MSMQANLASASIKPRPALRSYAMAMKPIELGEGAAPAKETALAPKVEIKDLRFFYKDYLALKGINMTLYDKRVTAFIGPSGCGKSTLLRSSTASTSSIPASAPPAR